MQTVYLDLETTGFTRQDEIVQIAIIDDEGNTLLSTLVKPQQQTQWKSAQAVHGISPANVTDAPTLDELRAEIIEYVSGKNVVIYNVDFDRKFLIEELKHAAELNCAMERFAEYYGDGNEYHQSYTWQKLTAAAAHIGFEWPAEGAHNATADCLATRAVWLYLANRQQPNQITTRDNSLS